MLLSMTGFGEAQSQTDGLEVSIELRAINNRYLKLSTRITDGYGAFEPKIEAIMRRQIRRGTVQVAIRIRREASPEDYALDQAVLESYRRQAEQIQAGWEQAQPVSLESLLALPGVVQENGRRAGTSEQTDAIWTVVEKTLQAAVEDLQAMREREGQAMATDMADNCRAITSSLTKIEARAPGVVDHYRDRLTDRLNKILDEFDVAVDAPDLIKEVGIFADRSDISEEIVRLKSHIEQFEGMMEEKESSGKRLEFLTQEMVRESNTIGSKANDLDISRNVIEIKAALERIREMVQNVE